MLETRDYSLICGFKKEAIFQEMIKKLKKKLKKAVIKPLKIVLVEQESTITCVHRSGESIRLDQKARYDKIMVRIIEKPEPQYGH